MSSPASVFPTCFSIMVLPPTKDLNAARFNYDTTEYRTFLYLRGGHVKSEDYAAFGEMGSREALTSSMHTRFNLVPSMSKEHRGEQLMHIKSSYNNKYLVAKQVEWHGDLVVGTADEPGEELSKPSCTLFKIEKSSKHCRRQQVRFLQPFMKRPASFVSGLATKSFYLDVDLVDVTGQIILPPYLSFKGHNGFSIGAVDFNGRTHLEFATSGKPVTPAVFTTLNFPDGQVCLKSELVGRYLTLGHAAWIMAESETFDHIGVLFKASKSGNFIVLRCVQNNLYCTVGKKDGREFLEASAANIINNVKLTIEEPLLSRAIYNIQYHRKDQARFYDITDMNMATAVAFNETSEKNTVKSSMSVTTTESHKHDSTSAHKFYGSASVSAQFTLGGLVNMGVSAGGGYGYDNEKIWGKEDETEKKQEIEYELTIPANRKVTLTVTAKELKFNVPFSYTQKDTLQSGESIIYNYDDGLYTGVNCFDLSYTTEEEVIDPKKEEIEASKKRKEMAK